jgi:hypothetical protein
MKPLHSAAAALALAAALAFAATPVEDWIGTALRAPRATLFSGSTRALL